MSVTVNGVEFTGNPCRVVSTTLNGRYVEMGEAGMAHLFWTEAKLRALGFYIYVVQSAFNSGVPASAGTHDYDKVIDLYVISVRTGRKSWIKGQRWLRRFGWADWWRHTGTWYLPSSWHHHMVSLTWVRDHCRVGIYVPGQVADYMAKPPRNGLSGHPYDLSWHPKDIPSTIFNYDEWYRKQVEDMGYKDWSADDKDAFWSDFEKRGARAVWDAPMNVSADGGAEFDGKTFRGWAKGVWNMLKGGK